MTASDVTNLFSPVQSVYPEVAGILPFVKSGPKFIQSVQHGFRKKNWSHPDCLHSGWRGTYPILSFQNGTNTVYANAPSLNAGSYTEQLISGFAAQVCCVMPDYLGFGSSTEVFIPTWLRMAQSVDPRSIRAVKEMGNKAELKLKLSKDLYIMGYSQGGLATLQLHKSIETSYSSEFNLKAVGCGPDLTTSPHHPNGFSAYLLPQPYYIAYIMKGFKSVGASRIPIPIYSTNLMHLGSKDFSMASTVAPPSTNNCRTVFPSSLQQISGPTLPPVPNTKECWTHWQPAVSWHGGSKRL